jgi:hypothetical protein
MQREVIWAPSDAPGLEHLRLSVEGASVRADGLVIGLDAEQAFRAHYVLRCDSEWRVRELEVAVLSGDEPSLRLLSDGQGHWSTSEGAALPLLDGCIDVDLSATPFTNTLPIRRLAWQHGRSVELQMVYVEIPALRVSVYPQRYTCLEGPIPAGRFRFESLRIDFTADISVDADGLVVDYPRLFRRVWSA